MRSKALIAGLTVSALCLSSAGCGLIGGGSKFGPSKLAEFAKNDGATIYDNVDDWEDAWKDLDIYDKDCLDMASDGMCVTVKGKDLKDAVEVLGTGSEMDFYDKSMTEGTLYTRIDSDGESSFSMLIAGSFTFENKDAATDFFESWTDLFEEVEKDDYVAYDDFDEGDVHCAMFLRNSIASYSVGLYQHGQEILIIYGNGSTPDETEDIVADVTSAMEVPAPAEKLDQPEQFDLIETAASLETVASSEIEVIEIETEETTESTVSFEENYAAAIAGYIAVLQENESAIKSIEDYFSYSGGFCGLYDMNADGYPDMYFVSEDPNQSMGAITGDLYIYSYDPATGNVFCVATLARVIYAAGDGGSSMIYLTPDYIVLCKNYGEELYESYSETVYDHSWAEVSSFSRSYEYDYENGETDWYYVNGTETDQATYDAVLAGYIDSANFVVRNNIWFNTDDYEYSLFDLPALETQYGYDSLMSELEGMA